MRLYTSELVKKYKARTVVDHVSIDVNQGEIVGLLGPNGAGKTTTFYMIVGLIKPNEGRIFLESDEGQASELTDLPVYRRAQLGVGYLAQEASVFRRLSVEDNIRAVLEMTSFSKEYQNERVEALIEEFRLQKVRKSLGIQLSGGERRRTEIARAVAINPAFILLDEPFAGVDPIAVEDIQDSVEKVLSEAGYADVAKAYILYRKQREKVRNVNSTLLNYRELVDNYLQINDWRVKENSTVSYSVGGLILSNSGAITANYWLSEIYDEEIGSGKIGRSGVSLLDQWYTNLYCAVFKTETDGTRQIDFMDRMAMLWRLERDYRSIDDNPVNTGVQIYETVAVVFVLILLIGSSFSKWRQKKKN